MKFGASVQGAGSAAQVESHRLGKWRRNLPFAVRDNSESPCLANGSDVSAPSIKAAQSATRFLPVPGPSSDKCTSSSAFPRDHIARRVRRWLALDLKRDWPWIRSSNCMRLFQRPLSSRHANRHLCPPLQPSMVFVNSKEARQVKNLNAFGLRESLAIAVVTPCWLDMLPCRHGLLYVIQYQLTALSGIDRTTWVRSPAALSNGRPTWPSSVLRKLSSTPST